MWRKKHSGNSFCDNICEDMRTRCCHKENFSQCSDYNALLTLENTSPCAAKYTMFSTIDFESVMSPTIDIPSHLSRCRSKTHTITQRPGVDTNMSFSTWNRIKGSKCFNDVIKGSKCFNDFIKGSKCLNDCINKAKTITINESPPQQGKLAIVDPSPRTFHAKERQKSSRDKGESKDKPQRKKAHVKAHVDDLRDKFSRMSGKTLRGDECDDSGPHRNGEASSLAQNWFGHHRMQERNEAKIFSGTSSQKKL